ncbi:MAG: ROK family transcriptional regulator [Anaerovoracaceae bacterium]|jgi:predicted NBD/HSP70 family sugar kinase
MVRQKMTQREIAKINRMLILNSIREKGVATKYDISSTLKLSHTTVNTYVAQLMQEGLVKEAGYGASIGGRRPVMVEIAKTAGYFFGVVLAPHRVTLTLVNLIGEELARRNVPYGIGEPFPGILDQLDNMMERMLDQEKISRKHVRGVGMVFPGVVDHEELYVEYAPNIGVRDFSLKDFEKKLGMKLYIENEAIAGLLAEQFAGDVDPGQNVVYVSVAEGIGAAVWINHEIYRSNNGRAGEFGHVNVDPDGLQCKCGRKGCWELYASKDAFERYQKEYGESSQKALEIYTEYLFKGLESILLAVSPDEILIGGEPVDVLRQAVDLGVERLRCNKKFYGYEKTPIRATSLSENPVYMGSYLVPFARTYRVKQFGI